MADAESDGSDVVKTIGQIFALAAGLIGLVYAAGGGVLALRLYLAHLPSRTIVGQLPREVLISVGLSQVVLPVLVVAAFYAAYRLLLGSAPPPKWLVRQRTERSLRAHAALVGASAVPAMAVAGLIALGATSAGTRSAQLLWLVPAEKVALLAFLLTLVTVLVALNIRARLVEQYGDPQGRWSGRRPIALMTIVIAVALVPVSVLLSGAFYPLLDAKVCTSLSEVRGVLIGETTDRTYLGETGEPPLRVFSVPGSQITETFIGGDADSLPCPLPTPASD